MKNCGRTAALSHAANSSKTHNAANTPVVHTSIPCTLQHTLHTTPGLTCTPFSHAVEFQSMAPA